MTKQITKQITQEQIKEHLLICLECMRDMIEGDKFYGASIFTKDIQNNIIKLKKMNK